MPQTPAAECGPACSEQHTYRSGECAAAAQPATRYPYDDGGVIVLGPEIFASRDGKVISWKGQHFVPHTAPPPAAENLPAGSLASAVTGAAMLDAAARDPRTQNLLAHALTQLARDGWLRETPGDTFDPADVDRPTAEPLDAAAATEATGAPQLCEIPHATTAEAEACERRRLAGGAELPPHGAPVALAEPAAPGTLRERLFATVRFLLGDGPWDVAAWHIADACLAEALRPVAVDDEQQTGGFRFVDPDGDHLYVTPTRRHGRPAVNLRAIRADGQGAAAVDVPADQVEDVIAGMRDVRRQASTDALPTRPRVPDDGEQQRDGVRVEYRASVPRHLFGAALAEGLSAVAAEVAAQDGRPAIG